MTESKKSTKISLKQPPRCTLVNPSTPLAGLGDSLSKPQTGRIQGTAVSLIRWQVSVTHSQLEPHWQDSGDRSQLDPQILADLGDTKSDRAANPGRLWRHQVQPSCKSWQTSATPSPTELQILALTVRASPKLVRQMSSALTELNINWTSVDIGITEGNNHNCVHGGFEIK
ncbi:hypothetical protein L3X38_040657 [Prunus dulcis]|uniref:Uncharacterized protein n=1 Tax=Prunus dulcis TaxID=3755 RepID=A0AAD4YTQ0_PRUDU|nr:hypothetical protein L3X38_040657 [Prunus dulcis]